MKRAYHLLTRIGMAIVLLALAVNAGLVRASATGLVYYVDAASGSDSNDGSQGSPWKTIQKAADSLSAGQTVSVAAGQYDEEVTITHSGAAKAPISFQAKGTVVVRSFRLEASFFA